MTTSSNPVTAQILAYVRSIPRSTATRIALALGHDVHGKTFEQGIMTGLYTRVLVGHRTPGARDLSYSAR